MIQAYNKIIEIRSSNSNRNGIKVEIGSRYQKRHQVSESNQTGRRIVFLVRVGIRVLCESRHPQSLGQEPDT